MNQSNCVILQNPTCETYPLPLFCGLLFSNSPPQLLGCSQYVPASHVYTGASKRAHADMQVGVQRGSVVLNGGCARSRGSLHLNVPCRHLTGTQANTHVHSRCYVVVIYSTAIKTWGYWRSTYVAREASHQLRPASAIKRRTWERWWQHGRQRREARA